MSKKIKRYKYSSDYYRSSSSRKKSSDDKKKSFDSEKIKAGSDINRLESQYKLSDPRGFTSYHLEKHSDKKFLEENKGDVKTQKLKDEFLPVETDRCLLEESSQTKDLQSTPPLSEIKPDSETIKTILQKQGTLANLVTGNLTSGFTSKCLEETLADKSDEKSPDWSSSIKTFGLDSIDNKKENIVKPSLIKTQKTSKNSDRTLLGKRITLESFAHLLDKARDEKNRGEIKDKKSDEASSQSSSSVSESKKTEKTSPSDKASDKKIEDNLQKNLDKFVEKKLEAIFSSRSEKSGSSEKAKETEENNSEEKSFKDIEKQVDEFIKNELSQAPKEKTPVTESPQKKFDEQEKSGQGTDKIKDDKKKEKVSSWITHGPGKPKEAKAARGKKKDDVKKAISSGMDKKKLHKDIKDKAQSGRIFDGKEPLKDRAPVFGKPENSLSGKETREDRKIDRPDEKLKSGRGKEFSSLQSDEQKNIRKPELHFQSPEKSHLNALDSEKYHDEKKVDDKEKIEKSGRAKESLPSHVISQKYEKRDVSETDGISDSEKKSGEAEKKEEVSSLAKEKIAEKPLSSLINTGAGVDDRDEKIIKDKKVEEFKEKGFPGEKPFGASLMPSAGLLKLPGKDRLPQKFTGKFSRFHRVGLLQLPGHGSSPQFKGDSKRLPEKTPLPEDKSKVGEHLWEKLQTASKSGPIPQIGIGLMSREGLNLNTDISKMKLPGMETKSKGNIKLDIKPEVLQKFYGELKTSPEVAPETPEKSGITAVADKSIFDKPGRQIDEFLEKDIKEKPSLKSEGKFFNVLDTFLQRDKKGDSGGTSPGHITEKLSGNMEKEIRKLVDRGLRETGLFASGLKKLLTGRGFSPDVGKKSEEGGISGSRGIDFKKTSGKPGAKEKISGKRKNRNIQRKKKEALFSTGSKKTVKGPETTGGKRELKEKPDKIKHKKKEEFSSQVSEKELSSGKSDSVTEKTLKEDKKVNVIEGEALRRSDDFREMKSDKIDSRKIVSPEDTKDISQDKKADKSENIIDKTSSEEIQKPDSILRSDGDRDTELTHKPGDKNTEEKEPSLSKADPQDLYQKSESQPGETSGKDEPEKTGTVKEVKPDEPEEKKKYSEQPFGPSLLPSAGLLKLPGLDRLPVKPRKGLMPLHRVALMSLPATGFPGKIWDKPLQVKPDMNSQTSKKSVPEKREQDVIRPQAGPIPQISVGHMSPHPGTASVAFQGKEKIKLPGISMKSGIDKGVDPEKGISQKPRTIKDEKKTHESTEKHFSYKDKKAEDKPEEKKTYPSVEKVEKDSGKDITPAEKEVKDKKVETDKPEIQKEEIKSQPEVKLPSRAEGKSSEAFRDRIEKTDSELSMLKEYKNAKTDEEKEKIASDYEKLTDKKLKADTLDKDIKGLEKEKHRLESIDDKNKEYNKCIDGVCKVDKESSLLKEYQSATGNEDKKAIAENYKKLTGRDLNPENIDRQLKDLNGSRNKLVDEAKKTYDEQLKLLKPAERKKLEKSEKSYNQTAGDLAGLNKEKIDEKKSFDKDMKRLNKELEGLEPGSREYEKKSREIQDRRQAHTDFEDKLSGKEQDTIEKRKELEKLQGELGTGLRHPELTAEEQKKYSAIDDMYTGSTLPDKINPVENMINKAKVTDEFVTSDLFSSSQLEVARNEGATITVAPPGETSGKDDREKSSAIKDDKAGESKARSAPEEDTKTEDTKEPEDNKVDEAKAKSAPDEEAEEVRDSNETPEITDKKEELVETIQSDPEASEKFEQLSSEDQEKVLKLAEDIKSTTPDGEESGSGETSDGKVEASEKLVENVTKLLKEDKLTQTDSEGKTVLDNLTEMKDQKAPEEIADKKSEIVAQVVDNIANPETINQGNRETCAAAVVEHKLAKEDAGEYTKIAKELTSTEGEAALKSGELLKRDDGNKEIGDKGCLEDDGSGRKDVSRIMQSSIMEHANEDKDYVTKKDEVKDNKVEVDKTDKSKDTNINPDGTDDGAGLTDKETEKAIKDIFGKDANVVSISNDRTAEELNKANNDIQKTLKEGETVPVKLQWGEGSHELTVEKMDDKYVYMKNPWGDKDTGKGGPEREVLDDTGQIRMTREEFDKNLKNYTSFSEKSPETQKQEIKRESEVKLPPRAEGKSSEAFQDRIKKTDSELSMLKDYKNAKTDGEKEKIAGDYKKLTDKELKAENVDKDIKGLESEKERLENIDSKNKEYNKCIDDVGKADRERSLLKEYQSTTGDENKKAIAEDYKELTGRDLNPENIDKQLKDLDGNRNKLVDQAKKTYDEQLNLLTPAERKELEKSEKSYNQTAGDLAGLNKEKSEENKSLDKDMQRLKKDLEGLEPGSKEYEKKSQEIKDRWQAHNDSEDKLSAKEQDTIEKRKELEKLQGELGIGLRQPELTEDQQKKYSAVNDMYTGTIPPDKSNPVENMINKAKITDELATSGLYSSSQLEAAKNMGTTITVTSPGEKGFHGPGGTGGCVQGDRIYLSGDTLKGTAKQEMSHIIQSKNIKGTEQTGCKQLTQDEFFEKFKGTNSQDLKKITGTEKSYFKPGGKVDKKKEKAGVSGSGVPQGDGMTPQSGFSGPIYQGGRRSRPGQIPSDNVPTRGPVVPGSRGQQTYQNSPGSYSPSTPQSSTPSGSVNQGPGGTSSGSVSQGSGGLSPSGSAGQGSGGLSSSGPGIHGDTSSGAGSLTGEGTAAGGIGSSSYIPQPDFLDKESDLKDNFSSDEEELKSKEAGDNDGVEEGQDNKSGKDGREIKEDKDTKKIKTEEDSKKIKSETETQKNKTDETEKKTKAETETQKTKTEEIEKTIKAESDTQKTKPEGDTKKTGVETDTQKVKAEASTHKDKVETDMQKIKTETDTQKSKAETDIQKIKSETDTRKTGPEGDTQKIKAERDIQRIKSETDTQKIKAETDIQRIKSETDAQKIKTETDMQKIKTETDGKKIGVSEDSKKIQAGEEGNKTGKGEKDGRSSFSPESQKTEGQKNKAGTESQTSRPVDEGSKTQTSKAEGSDMTRTAEGEKQIKSSESASQNRETVQQAKSGDAVKATAEQTQKPAISEQMQKISSQEVQKSSPQNIQKPEDLQKPAGPGLISRPSGLQEDKKVPPQQPVISQEGNKTSVTQKGQTVAGQSQSLQQGFRPAGFETGNKELSGQQLQKSVLTQDAPKFQKTPEAVAPQPVLKPVTMKNDGQPAVLQLGRKLTAPQDIQQVQRAVIQEGQKPVTQESQKPVIQDTQKSVDLQSQKIGINQQGQKIATPLPVQKPVAPLWEQKNVLPDQQVQKALSSQQPQQSSILHDLQKTQGSQEIQKSVTPQNLSKPVLQEGQKPVISQESQKSSLSQLSRKEVVLQPVQKSVDPQQSQKTSVSDLQQGIAQSDGKKVLTSQQITEQKLLAEGQKPSVLRAKPEGEISQQIKGEKLLQEGQKPSVFSSEKKPFSLQDIQKVFKAEGQKSIIPQDAQKPGLNEGIKKSDHVQQANKTDLSGPVRTDDQVKSRLQKLDQIRVDAAKDNSLKIAGKEGEASKVPSLIKGGEGIKGIKENRGLKMNDALAGLKELKKEAFSGLKSTKMDKQTAEMFKSPGNQKISDRYGFLAGLKGDSKTGKAFSALTGMIGNLPGKDLNVLQKNLQDKTPVSGGLKVNDSQKNSGPVVKKSFVNTFKSLSGQHALFKKEIIETSQKADEGKRVTTEKQRDLPQNEGLFKKIGNLVKNTIKSLSGGISIHKFMESLGRRTGLSVNSMELLRGSDKVGNLKELQKNVEVLNTTSVTGFKNQIKEIFKALTSKPFSPDAGQALAKRAGLSVNSMELLGGNNDRVKSLKNSMEQAFKPQFSQAFKETALKDASYVEKGGKGTGFKAVAFKEGLARGLNIDISSTFKALSNKPVVQKSFVNLLQERTGQSINTVSLFKGDGGNIKDLKNLHTRLTKLSLTDELGLHKGVFISDEEIKNRKKHLSREMENSMEWDRTKYVSLSPSDLQVESKLKLLRLCQMCQAPVTVDIVLCPSCARLRRQIYTELKVFYSKNSEKNYFEKPLSNVYNSRSSMEDTSKVIGKGRETLNLSMDAVNLFDTQEPGEVLTLRKEQILPKMKDILALSRGNSMFTDRQLLYN